MSSDGLLISFKIEVSIKNRKTPNRSPNTEIETLRSPLGLKKTHSDFLTCIIILLVVPFLPLLIEMYYNSGFPTILSVSIAAAMFGAATCVSGLDPVTKSFGLVASIFCAALHGAAMAEDPVGSLQEALRGFGPNPNRDLRDILIYGIAIVALIVLQSIERYKKHVIGGQPFNVFETTE